MKILFIFVLLVMAGCDNAGDDGKLTGTFNLEGEEIATTTYFYDNRADLMRVYEDRFGRALELSHEGFAVATMDRFNGHRCEIHTLKIRSETDNYRITLLGHEALHCLLGLWHEQLT